MLEEGIGLVLYEVSFTKYCICPRCLFARLQRVYGGGGHLKHRQELSRLPLNGRPAGNHVCFDLCYLHANLNDGHQQV